MRTDKQKVAQLSHKHRDAGWVSFCQKYIQPLWRNLPAKLSNSVKKHKIRAIMP